MQEGPYPYTDSDDDSYTENTEGQQTIDNKDYEASLNTENGQRLETFQNPYDVMGPRENYFTVQKGNRRYDTVITQSFGNKEAPETHENDQIDPALGSEYVSYPQDSLKDNALEQYWDYVPIENKLDLPKGHHKSNPVLGIQRSVEHKAKAHKKPLVSPKSSNYNKAPSSFTDRHSVDEEKSGTSVGKQAQKSEKKDADKQKKRKEEESGRKRYNSNVFVRNRSPEPGGMY